MQFNLHGEPVSWVLLASFYRRIKWAQGHTLLEEGQKGAKGQDQWNAEFMHGTLMLKCS